MRDRSRSPSRRASWPSISTFPLVGASSNPMILSNVLLPDPEGPTMTTNSPASTLRLTDERARVSTRPARYSLSILSSLTIGASRSSIRAKLRTHNDSISVSRWNAGGFSASRSAKDQSRTSSGSPLKIGAQPRLRTHWACPAPDRSLLGGAHSPRCTGRRPSETIPRREHPDASRDVCSGVVAPP